MMFKRKQQRIEELEAELHKVRHAGEVAGETCVSQRKRIEELEASNMTDKVSNWDIRDIPAGLRDYRVVTEPNTVTGEIKVTTEIMGRIQEEIIQTKSDQTRNALIDLGWTPPAGKESRPESKLPEGFRDKNLPKAPDCYFHGVQITELCVSDLVAAMAFLVEDISRERE